MKACKMFHRKERGILITRLMARDGTCCALCRAPLDRSVRDELSPEYVTVDHRVPQSLGGTSEPSNLQLAHARCNRTRGNAPMPG